MTERATIPLLDHELAEDELTLMATVQEEFRKIRASFSGREQDFNPKEALRDLLRRDAFRLETPANLSGPGPWPLGRNRHGRRVTAVFLKRVELHRHEKTRTDQFLIYVVGEADAFSIGDGGQPVFSPVAGGDHVHNPPNAPHAFLPKVGKPVPEDWEISFIAITPRDLREDTRAVSDDVKAAYRRVVGADAPAGV